MSGSLFDDDPLPAAAAAPAAPTAGIPLAERLRPKTLDEVIGQRHLLGPGMPLRVAFDAGRLHSMILWGPPGVGKTTLARLMAGGPTQTGSMDGLTLNGVVLLGQAMDMARGAEGDDRAYLAILPSLAATACHFGKAAPGCTPEGQVAAARRFVETSYLAALHAGLGARDHQADPLAERVLGDLLALVGGAQRGDLGQGAPVELLPRGEPVGGEVGQPAVVSGDAGERRGDRVETGVVLDVLVGAGVDAASHASTLDQVVGFRRAPPPAPAVAAARTARGAVARPASGRRGTAPASPCCGPPGAGCRTAARTGSRRR